ncbi:multifunctional CCA addition/repair protein [Chitinimonas sp.]|uniref:multifunctional CCA addition/repair protein n=1 Tax=Chitinimonas sp. TaxID=1934313 RepID=UPI0035AFEA04
MKIYTVGGAVRDELLGLPVQDRDYVVVGSSPEEMLAAGFKPVGKDFPVFLHPRSHEEYALARTERKSGHGYKGFTVYAAPDVSLEEDLLRRDLTINAMAMDEDGQLIDPYGGQDDLAARCLRHVSPAFAEDPVRILRLARFAARFGFSVAPDTQALMREMVQLGEVDHLVAERVWQELSRGLMEATPSRMLTVLHTCGALARLLPEVAALFDQAAPAPIDSATLAAMLDAMASTAAPLDSRFAALCLLLSKARLAPFASSEAGQVIEALCERLRVPNDCRELGLLACREWHAIETAADAESILGVLQRCDALRKPARFIRLLAVCTGELAAERAQLLQQCRDRASQVDAGAIAATVSNKADIAQAVRLARLDALQSLLPTKPYGSSESAGQTPALP